jgi:hypothetical protein
LHAPIRRVRRRGLLIGKADIAVQRSWPGHVEQSPNVDCLISFERIRSMRTMKTPDAPPVVIVTVAKSSKIMSARLMIRTDEAARRRIADTDGTLRRSRELAERNRLI